MPNTSLLLDYYRKIVPEKTVMVPTTSGKPYVPNYTTQKTNTNTQTPTKTTTTPTNKTTTPTAGMNDAGLALYNNLIGGTPTPNTNQGFVTEPTPPTITQPQPIYQQPTYQQPQFDPTEYVNQLKDARRQSRISALDKAKTSALGSLDTEKANVAPTYYDKRNQAAAASDVGAMNFANYMAARGIKGAAGAMPEIYRNAGLQGQIGALDRQEASNLAGIERQRANINTGYESDVASANADVEAQAMQAMIDQYNTNRNYALSQAQLTGSLGDARTLAGQEYEYSKSASNPTVQAQILANKAQELENAAQEIQNSYLPDTLKQQAQRLAQQVKAGALDYDTALAQLNQIKAQTASVGSSAVKQPTQTETANYYISSAIKQMQGMDLQQANNWLYQHKAEIIENGGASAYNTLLAHLYPEQ
jgi:hypothetical protein